MAVKKFGAPSLASARRYSVNTPNVEAVRQPLYDIQTYAAAGQTSLNFFQVPQGQGYSSIAADTTKGVKTKEDTNMEMAGSLPSPKSFLITDIEVVIFPVTPVPTSALAATAINAFVNDVWKVFSRGYLNLFIGSKDYLTAPISRFPSRTKIEGFAALAGTTTADTKLNSTCYATIGGPVFKLDPAVLLVPTQNFSVSLNWSEAVALSAASRIGVFLNGILYRNSQ